MTIEEALEQSGNTTEAAKLLGCSPRTLYPKIAADDRLWQARERGRKKRIAENVEKASRAIEKYGSAKKAAKHLGVHWRTVYCWLNCGRR